LTSLERAQSGLLRAPGDTFASAISALGRRIALQQLRKWTLLQVSGCTANDMSHVTY